MTNEKTLKNGELTIALAGRLDTMTAPELEAELGEALEGAEKVAFDLADLEYMSSAGLRILLSTQKKMMAKGGSVVVRNANETITEIFEVTGFSDILTIE